MNLWRWRRDTCGWGLAAAGMKSVMTSGGKFEIKSNRIKRIMLKQNSPICWSQAGVTGRKKGASTGGKEGSEFSPAVSLFSSFPSLFLFLSLPQICFFIHPSHFLHLYNIFFPLPFQRVTFCPVHQRKCAKNLNWPPKSIKATKGRQCRHKEWISSFVLPDYLDLMIL